jgi:hypothetical protein
VDHLRTAQAIVLHKAAVEARKALQEAFEKYESAYKIAIDTEPIGNDGISALRHKGRAYANALNRYSEAAMAWLVYVETHLLPKNADAKGAGS